MNLRNYLVISSKTLSELKMLKSILLILRNTRSTLRLDWEEVILMMGSRNILIMIGKYFLLRLSGKIPLLKEDRIFILSTTSSLMTPLRSRNLGTKTQVETPSLSFSTGKNYPKRLSTLSTLA